MYKKMGKNMYYDGFEVQPGTRLKFGKITEVDLGAGRARVNIPDADITTHMLPVVFPGTNPTSGGGAFSWDLGTNDFVAVLLDANMVDGVILGAVYGGSRQPGSAAAPDKGLKIVFPGGITILQDGTGVVSVATATGMEVKVEPTGITVGSSGDSLAAIIGDLVDAMAAETHLSATPGAPTGPPINLATYLAIKARALLFLK